jgi:hypothetical protein
MEQSLLVGSEFGDVLDGQEVVAFPLELSVY